ncbi:unnamed protein product [Amoebophrya sp. A120]|nr:unnamed protein product [Amoebophrya sp. A120]|eukprot:GSA120T00008614001.1
MGVNRLPRRIVGVLSTLLLEAQQHGKFFLYPGVAAAAVVPPSVGTSRRSTAEAIAAPAAEQVTPTVEDEDADSKMVGPNHYQETPTVEDDATPASSLLQVSSSTAPAVLPGATTASAGTSEHQDSHQAVFPRQEVASSEEEGKHTRIVAPAETKPAARSATSVQDIKSNRILQGNRDHDDESQMKNHDQKLVVAHKTDEQDQDTVGDDAVRQLETAQKSSTTKPSSPIDPSELHPPPEFGSFLYFARWFWWVLIAYMFFAQATVCDEWFVPAIEVVCEKYGIPEDVAGATLMALGCNGPELFTNAIALFVTHSDVGVGTIVGSEIFNLLLIIGISILASPKLPLIVDKWPFLRDCFFYLLSIGLLYWVLQDGVVTLYESLVLLTFAGFFGCAVGYTNRVLVYFGVRSGEKNGFICSSGEEGVAGINTGGDEEDLEWSSDCPFVPMDEKATISVQRTSQLEGRTTARSHKLEIHASYFVAEGLDVFENNYTRAGGNKASGSSSLIGSGALSCAVEMTGANKSSSPCCAPGRGQKEVSAATLNALSSAGLAAPLLTSSEDMSDRSTTAKDSCHGDNDLFTSNKMKCGTTKNIKTKDASILNNYASPCKGTSSSTTTTRTAANNFTKPQNRKLYFRDTLCTTQLEGPTQISFRDKNDDSISYFVSFSSEAVLGQVLDLMEKARDKRTQQHLSSPKFSVTGTVSQICSAGVPTSQKVYLAAALPVNFLLESTMRWCDPKNPKTKPLWLVAFTISMCWLAVFSYVMVTVADIINIQFHITQAILGVTLCAAGTSFPNLWASYITAKEGKSSMAVANALGSNVQNVFLALALPWVVKTFFAENNAIPMATPGIMDGVVWMGGTWLLLVMLAVGNDYGLQPWMGYLFFGLYAVYLVDACFIHTS